MHAPAADRHVAAVFQSLGERIEAAYRATGYDEAALPQLAVAALTEQPPCEALAVDDVLCWALSAAELPRQADVEGRFGQPAIQVFSTPRWYIEVLHWFDGTTTIHQHSFAGAFHVLAGSSIHARYEFAQQRRYAAHLRVGTLEQREVELLERGATRSILPGSGLIHSLFHLDRPSLTVVVRTTHVADAFPQLSYLPPGIAHDPFHVDELLARKRQCIDALVRLEHPQLDARLATLLGDADPPAATALLLHALGRVTIDQLPHACARACEVHGELATLTIAAALEQRRQDALVGLRARLRGADHRFLLALLLHFDHGAPILEFMRRRWPERDPADEALRLLGELADLPDPRRPGRRVFELELQGPVRVAARALIEGRSLDETATFVRERCGLDAPRAELARLRAELGASLLAPLVHAPLHSRGSRRVDALHDSTPHNPEVITNMPVSIARL